jgi:hypothetical protein
MVEAAIACALLLYLLLLALPGIELQALLGAILTVVGLVGGGSAGLVYHFALRRALLRLGVGTKGWLWTPWFRIGAAGFILCVAGIGMLAVASLRAAVL